MNRYVSWGLDGLMVTALLAVGLTFTDNAGITPNWANPNGRCLSDFPPVEQIDWLIDLSLDVAANVVQDAQDDSVRRGVEIRFRRLPNEGAFDSTTYEFWFQSPNDDPMFSAVWPYDGNDACVRVKHTTAPEFQPEYEYTVKYRAGVIGGQVIEYDSLHAVIDSTQHGDTVWTSWSEEGTFTYPAAIHVTHVSLPTPDFETGPFKIRMVYTERYVFNTDSIAVPLIISEIAVKTGESYTLQPALVPGELQYVDRSYTITDIPAELVGLPFLQTANGDKNADLGDPLWLRFTLNRETVIYVAHDRRIPIPTWMNDWTDTGLTIGTSDVSFGVYSQVFYSGVVWLGSNNEVDTPGSSMYSVIFGG